MINVEIKLFGAFRKYQKGSATVSLTLEPPLSVDQVKSALSSYLSQQAHTATSGASTSKQEIHQLVLDSALANDTEILTKDVMVDQSCRLSILPPVCGG